MNNSVLGSMVEEFQDEIWAEWERLLVTIGLPYQREMVQAQPNYVHATYERLARLLIRSLTDDDEDERRRAHSALLRRYEDFGRQWAEQEGAEPNMAVAAPRLTEALWTVLVRTSLSKLPPDDLLVVFSELHRLAMEMAMARVYGYMSYKEEILALQQAALASVTDQLTRVGANERRAIALMLHDNLAQQVASLFSGIQRCELLLEKNPAGLADELLRLHRVAQETTRGAREMIRDLHFGSTTKEGGISELADYLGDLENDTGIKHTLTVPASSVELTPTAESLVIRLIQEAVTNARKHALPRRIDVAIAVVDDRLVVTIADDGCGFDVKESMKDAERNGHIGLIGMIERSRLLGASMNIDSSVGKGTTVSLTIPRPGHD